jgi:hypothetical protein
MTPRRLVHTRIHSLISMRFADGQGLADDRSIDDAYDEEMPQL